MVAFADVGHHGHVAVVEGKALAKDSAAGGLENGHIDRRIYENAPRALRAAAIAAVDAAVIHENAVRAGHTHRLTSPAKHVGDEPRRGRLAVHAGHGDDGNPPGFAAREEDVGDRFAHRPRNADRRLQVHPQARGGVHLDDDSSLFAQRAGNVLCHHVDAGDVQPHDLGRIHGVGRHGRMHALGDVDGRAAGAQIRVAANQHRRAGRRNRRRARSPDRPARPRPPRRA